MGEINLFLGYKSLGVKGVAWYLETNARMRYD